MKEFFNHFINRVIIFEDRIEIYYNFAHDTANEVKILEKKEDVMLGMNENHGEENKNNPFEFKRVALGAPTRT